MRLARFRVPESRAGRHRLVSGFQHHERLPADSAVDVAHRMWEAPRVAQSIDVELCSRERPGRCRSRGRHAGRNVAPLVRRVARCADRTSIRDGVTADDGDPNRRPVVQRRLPMVPRAGALRWGLQSDRHRVIVPRRRCPNAENRGGVDRTAHRRPRKPTWLRLADQHPICTLSAPHPSELYSNNWCL